MASLGGKKPKPVHEREWEKLLSGQIPCTSIKRSVSVVTGEVVLPSDLQSSRTFEKQKSDSREPE